MASKGNKLSLSSEQISGLDLIKGLKSAPHTLKSSTDRINSSEKRDEMVG